MPLESNEKRQKKEALLIRGCQNNERASQFELFRIYSCKMMGIAMRFAGNRDTANDLLQEAFIRIFKNIMQYQNTGSFEAWMRKILIRTSIDFMKKHGKLYFEEIDDNVNTPIISPSFSIEKMNCEAIIEEISALPEGYRTILNLVAIEGYTYPEIADLLNIKEVSVRSQYMRAKNKLACALKEKNIAYYVQKII